LSRARAAPKIGLPVSAGFTDTPDHVESKRRGATVVCPSMPRFAVALITAVAVLLAGCGAVVASAGTDAAVSAAVVHCHARGSGVFVLPDARCTPGVTDPRVTQANIATTICRTGYTRTVRPPESVTARQKRVSMAAYGDTGSARRYEYDHLISLELGGAPDDTRNLWPEPGGSPNPKDRLENALHRDVCAGRMTLRAAQRTIARDWVAAYRARYG
jgi:hypothetical protein